MEFRLLGLLEVSADGRRLDLDRRKERALLAMLLMRAGQVVPVDRLIEDLWDANAPRSATSTLRTHVSHLRQTLTAAGEGDAIRTQPPGYLLDLDGHTFDVQTFEQVAASGRAALIDGDAPRAASLLAQSLDLWRGEPLADFRYETFAQHDVARLRETRLSVLEDRIEADISCGRHQFLVPELESLVAEHPLRERLWGALMLALYRAGRQAEALHTYQRVRRQLGDELGIEPSQPLVRLERRILVQDDALTWRDGAQSSGVERKRRHADIRPRPEAASGQETIDPLDLLVPERTPLPFVGRRCELDLLSEAWDRTSSGEATLALLTGELGVGKSRLAAELGHRLRAGGALVLTGRCDSALQAPYQPFREALGEWFDTAWPDPSTTTTGMPGRNAHRSGPPAAARLAENDVAGRRGHLFAAVGHTLGELSRERPILLILDDLQWADPSTLLLLRHLLRAPARRSILVVGTYRDGDVTGASTCDDVLSELRTRHNTVHVALNGLHEDEVAHLARQFISRPLGLHQSTGGNPFFVREMLVEGRSGAVPARVQEVVGRRVNRLSKAAQRILVSASMLGLDFTVDDLAPFPHGPAADEVIESLDEAAKAQLLCEVSPGRYRFAHAITSSVIYSGLSQSRRALLHAGAAELERQLVHAAPLANRVELIEDSDVLAS
jgi:DNA-binding SARP family transcriptional activator